MSFEDRWLLPDGVEDVLPPQARRVEAVRRHLLDLFETWGYEYVIPPMIEYLESLLTGTGHDLDLKTFKIVDLMTGRTMGMRADITPQVARIDAHSLNREGVSRLCYAGTVVQAKADSMLSSRVPLSVGAEMFGEASRKADIEIVSLMVESIASLELKEIHVDLGDVGIFRQLLNSLSLTPVQRDHLFAAVQKKSGAEIARLCAVFGLSEAETTLLTALPDLCGDQSMLARAEQVFAAHEGILACVANLREVADAITTRFDDLNIYFDLGELRGYAYHTGMVFAAYVNGTRDVCAKGGRYDDIGEVFGRGQRGATGFSLDVRALAEAWAPTMAERATVLVPASQGPIADSAGQWQEICRLRQAGYIVLESGNLNDHDFTLVFDNDQWRLVAREGE